MPGLRAQGFWLSVGTVEPRKNLCQTLRAFAQRGELKGVLAADGGDAAAVLARFASAGVDVDMLATELQRDGVLAFVKSWTELLQCIESKSVVLADTGG